MPEKHIKKDKLKGIALLVVGFLSSIMGFLATINIHFAWLTPDSISAFSVVIMAGISLIIGITAVWKNTFVSKKAQKQNEELKKKGLK